jgi:superfamily II DNA helicase RecQ
MALNATSTKKVKADITTHLHLQYNVFDEDTDIVYKSPDSLIGPTYLFRF